MKIPICLLISSCTYLLFLPPLSAESVNLTISLNKTISFDNKELYGDFSIIKANSTIQVNTENANKEISFIVFQVHSHWYNITLYNNTLVRGSYITGTNVGMYSMVKAPMDVFYILNTNAVDVKLYISIHGYGITDPIPGGCNMEFPINISPFMQVSYNQAYITVDAAPPKDPTEKTCQGASKAVVKFYRMYMQERRFDEDSYFDALRSMMSVGVIRGNGDELPQSKLSYQISPMRRMLSAYPGTGSVYVAVAYHATNESMYSVYVPTYTYACSPLDGHGCVLLDDITSQFFCSALIFIGIFTCFFGHRFFKTEMFIIGSFTGILITYILISLITELERPALLGASMLSGACFGAIWLLFWWFYGIPIFAVLLSTLYLGFFSASILYNGLPAGLQVIETDSTFWTLFIAIMTFTSLSLISTTYLSNILSCAILGSYATVFVIDHYVGSHLKFLVINTIRRATVAKFNVAELAMPFQWPDAMVTLIWLLLATSGFLFQHYHSRGKPPFPPPPRSVRPLPNDTGTRRSTVPPFPPPSRSVRTLINDTSTRRSYATMEATYGTIDGPGSSAGQYPGRIPIPAASTPTYGERTPLL